MIFLKKIILKTTSFFGFRNILPIARIIYKGNPIFYIPTKQKFCFLTIDDTPSPDVSKNDELLNILKSNDIKATFFIISSHIEEKHKTFFDSLIEDGHEIANHLKKNESAYHYSKNEFENDLLECEQIIQSFKKTQKRASRKLFRPPYGKISQTMINVLTEQKYLIVLGDLYSFDYHILDTDFHINYIMKNIKEGSIIILHFPEKSKNYQSIEILKKLIPALKKQGFTFKLLGDFLNHE